MKVLFVGLVCVIACSLGCSYVELRYHQNSVGVARSMEFPSPLFLAEDWKVVSHPAHVSESAARKLEQLPGYERVNWYESNPYGFVSIDGIFRSEQDLDVLHVLSGDGMNEFGLTVSTHTFVSAVYQPISFVKRNVAFLYFCPWALGNFKTADELVDALRNNVSVIDPVEGIDHIKFHWGVTDQFGKSYVIEYVDHELKIWDNTQVGVMTNDPVWQWHVQNLNTFATVTPQWSNGGQDLAINTPIGLIPQVLSYGYNLYGLPGDFTPQSRFARMWYLKNILLHNKKENITDISEAIVIGTALLNSVFIPKGSVASQANNDVIRDQGFTQYNVLKFPVEREFIFRSYENMQWKRLRLDNIDFSIGAKSLSMPVYDGTLGIQEATQSLQ